MNTNQLKHEAQHCNDPERLLELAKLLDYWSEYEAAEHARQKARKIENELAEVNA